MSIPSERTLSSLLLEGVGGAPADELRRRFELGEDAGDAALARALLREVVAEDARALGRQPMHTHSTSDDEPSRVVSLRQSYVTRMPASGRSDGLSVEGLRDLRTLLALVRAGSLAQRRAALARIGELLESDDDVPAALRKRTLDTLLDLRSPALAHETLHVLAAQSGAEGRDARAELKAWNELVQRLLPRIHAFWEGDEHAEPIASLAGEERALFFSLARDLPDLVAQHVAAVLEESAGPIEPGALRLLLRGIEHAGDPRLVPALRGLLEQQDAELIAPAARALAETNDPRVHGLLRDAYERAARTEERLLLAATLGAIGDARGAAYAREVFASSDPASSRAALEALAELGGSDDVQRICELLDGDDESLQRLAVCTLGRIADSRALVPLSRLRERTMRSALRAEVEEAEAAIGARMELLGEEPASTQAAAVTWDTTKHAALARAKDPALVRLRASWSYALGYFWSSIGAHTRAIARFEAAVTLRSDWVEPVLAVALLRRRHGETAQALAAFRRAVQTDRAYVESHGWAITAMAQAFLHRAEAMEREGRVEIARGLTEEILGFDLRRAAERVRFALRERGETRSSERTAS